MSEETLQRIFEPFFTTKEMGRGIGLGLCLRLRHHQKSRRLYHRVQPERPGSNFTVYMPCSETYLAQEAAPEDLVLKGSETVLIVDDEEIVLDVGVEILNPGVPGPVSKQRSEALEIYGSRSKRDRHRHPGHDHA